MSSAKPSNETPLGLTVHALPAAHDMGDLVSSRTTAGRWKMLAVMLICAAPVIASYLTFYVVRPEGRRNFGELVEPQRTLPNLVATSLDGKPVNLRSLNDQWLLISVSSGRCDALCANHLYLQRQLREGLGKEKDRLDWVWLVDDAVPVADALLPALKDATVLRLAKPELANWLEPQTGHTLHDHLYLVDPLGNWMMRFPAQVGAPDAVKVRRDLDRLLRASSHWDKPGR